MPAPFLRLLNAPRPLPPPRPKTLGEATWLVAQRWYYLLVAFLAVLTAITVLGVVYLGYRPQTARASSVLPTSERGSGTEAGRSSAAAGQHGATATTSRSPPG